MTDQPITVPPEQVAAIRNTLAMIQADARDDAARTEGLAMTGRNVGELFGNVLASISALAWIIDAILTTGDAPHVASPPVDRGSFALDADGHLVPTAEWFVTYPQGSNLRKNYSLVDAPSEAAARRRCAETLGREGWAFVYSVEDRGGGSSLADQIAAYGLTEVPFGTRAVIVR